jgi:methylase of polypeptide subunit release factors
MLRALAQGTYSLSALYRLAEDEGLADRPGGRTIIQDGAQQYRRRVRSALQQLRREGRARRMGEGVWAVEGHVERPRRCLLLFLPDEPGHVELVLGDAAEVLRRADEPVDLIVADPPWALDRGGDTAAYRRTYRRDADRVVGGYVEIDPDEYAEFTARWMTAAADALRPGGCLAVVTGAQQAARVQTVGEDDAGLTYVNSIAVQRTFPMYVTRRFVHAHNTVTVLTKGPLDTPLRFFERPDELPRGRSGEVYALDIWPDIPDERRPGRLRYDNALHPRLVRRLVRSCSRGAEDPADADLVADPFLGSGTTAVVCLREGRRFYGGDLNPEALRFTMARILDEEHAPGRAASTPRHLAAQGALF